MKASYKIILSSVSGLVLGLGIASTTLHLTSTSSNANAGTDSLAVVSTNMEEVSPELSENISAEAAVQIDFDKEVTLPETLPIDVEQRIEEVTELEGNPNEEEKLLTVYYINEEEKSFIALTSTDAVIQPDDPNAVEFSEDGTLFTYYDNNTYQFLSFEKDGISYEIKGQKNKDDASIKFTKNELMEVYKGM